MRHAPSHPIPPEAAPDWESADWETLRRAVASVESLPLRMNARVALRTLRDKHFDPDPELRLAWADMHAWIEAGNDGSCRYGACESDEACMCQEGEPDE